MKKPYLIAEIGVNFYDTAKELGITPMEAAKLYVKNAKEAGPLKVSVGSPTVSKSNSINTTKMIRYCY